ncbi:MAG: hypothetical protein ACREHD_30725 [Pirellulales bacterium]
MFAVSITESLKGESADDYLKVTVVHPESNADEKLAWLKKKSKLLLFLRNAGSHERPNWMSGDVWLSVQPYNGRMVSSLKRLVAETPKERLPLMEGIVLSEKDGVVELSLGADDGIQPGHVLFWYRDNVQLGRLVVSSATSDKSVAKYTLAADADAETGVPKKNDRIVTRPQ